VLNLLTKYLLHYRRVSIPSLGTIRLEHQPAQVNVVDKVILPPSYLVSIGEEGDVPDRQLLFLSAALQEEKSEVLQRLNTLGKQLKARVQNGGFYWEGIGHISDNQEPMPLLLPTLDPVPAEKVMRPDAEHQILVGDQQMTSTQMSVSKEEIDVVEKKERSVFVIIGWVLLVLSILYIVFILYQGKFRVRSTGSQQSPTSSLYFQQQDFNASHSQFPNNIIT
jgi:hypothetical protein